MISYVPKASFWENVGILGKFICKENIIPRPNVPFGMGGHFSPVEIAPTSHFTGQALFHNSRFAGPRDE